MLRLKIVLLLCWIAKKGKAVIFFSAHKQQLFSLKLLRKERGNICLLVGLHKPRMLPKMLSLNA